MNLSRRNKEKHTKHIIMKLLKASDKENLLKQTKKKSTVDRGTEKSPADLLQKPCKTEDNEQRF